tara:strand:+ start:3997 stop:4266 length:270 start_codon:yes stop_codon:yes gene_type:complete
MEYTEGLMRELENLEIFDKTDSLTEIGKNRIVSLRKCRDDFKKLHLTDDWKLHVKRLLQLVNSGAVDGNRLHNLKQTDTYNTLLKMTKQ